MLIPGLEDHAITYRDNIYQGTRGIYMDLMQVSVILLIFKKNPNMVNHKLR